MKLDTNSDVLVFGETHKDEKIRDVAVAVLFDRESLSFTLREDNDDGYTQFIRGRIEKEESQETAILREIKEETGFYDVTVSKNLGKEIIVNEYMDHKKVWRKSICYSYLVFINSFKKVDLNLSEGEFADYKLIEINYMANREDLSKINMAEYTKEIFIRAQKELNYQIEKGWLNLNF